MSANGPVASASQRAKRVVKLTMPLGLVKLYERRRERRIEEYLTGHTANLEERTAARAQDLRARDYSVENAIGLLVARGLDEEGVRLGSMPEASLEYTGGLLRDRLPTGRPLFALHVGNYLGVSLSYFTWLLRELHPESVMVSIDPDIRHLGVEKPQGHVLAVLNHFGLLSNSLVIPGYTLEQTFGDTPVWHDLDQQFLKEAACTEVLPSLARLCGRRFDLVLLDGNHRGDYLAREFAAVREVLADDSVVVFDDVMSDAWFGVSEVFRSALRDAPGTVVELGQDGRVGVLQVRSGTGA